MEKKIVKTFTSTGTWLCPPGVGKVKLIPGLHRLNQYNPPDTSYSNYYDVIPGHAYGIQFTSSPSFGDYIIAPSKIDELKIEYYQGS